MIIIQNAILPLGVLWEYREFKRDEVPSPIIPFVHNYTTDQITSYVDKNGIEPVELSVMQDRALLTDGNHRIVAARNLGYTEIPVIVTMFFSGTDQIFYDHTLERFKPVNDSLEIELTKLFHHNPVYQHLKARGVKAG